MTPEHADLVHRPADGKRAPLEVGAWAVYEQGDGLIPDLHLVRIVDGPTYRKDEQERAVDELWRCDDGQDRSRWRLTRVFVEETCADARAAVPCVLAGVKLDRRELDALALRCQRITALAAKRCTPLGSSQPLTPELEELAIVTCDLLDARDALHRFVHVSLPNLARNLYLVGLAGVAAEWGTRPPWPQNHHGDPHPRAAELVDLARRLK